MVEKNKAKIKEYKTIVTAKYIYISDWRIKS